MPFVRFCFFLGRNNHSRLPFSLCTELTFKKIPALISSGRKEKVIIRLWKYSRNGFRRMSESAVSIRRVSGVGISLKPGSCIMMRKMKTDRQTDGQRHGTLLRPTRSHRRLTWSNRFLLGSVFLLDRSRDCTGCRFRHAHMLSEQKKKTCPLIVLVFRFDSSTSLHCCPQMPC